ncbi:MAG: hypothetical protein Q8Q29_00895 [Actinomycetota bacterium]|nr:hypothetical protein [Actinomycetota bacterium]
MQPRVLQRILVSVVLIGALALLMFAPVATTPSPPSADPTTLTVPTTTAPTKPQLPTTTGQPTTTTSFAIRLPEVGPIFGEEIGVRLLFDDGYYGLAALDPDNRLVARSTVEGQRPGDEPYSMIRVGDKLVVGWGVPHVRDISSREVRSLGVATIFVPAAEPNRVWLIDYGERIGDQTPRVWQIDVTSAEALGDPVQVAGGHPVIGITGGLALQTDEGLSLWMLGTGQMRTLDADGPGWVHDVSDDELVWCDSECTELTVTNTATLATRRYEVPTGYDRFLGSARYSQRYLAALVGGQDAYDGEAIWILDTVTGDVTVVGDPETRVSFVAWAPAGDQLFASSASRFGGPTVIWRYDLTDGGFDAVVLPFGRAQRSVIVVDAAHAAAYFGDDLVDPNECLPPSLRTSGRSEVCTFSL